MDKIMQFRGEYSFLSNFHPAPIAMQGVGYPTVEHAFQAAKTLNPELRAVFTACSPAVVKAKGRQLPLRADWEQIKLDVMLRMLRMKFRRGSELAARLLATGDAELIEGNYWNDTYWGYSLQKGVGENHLGRLLMQVRSELRVRAQREQVEHAYLELDRAKDAVDVPW